MRTTATTTDARGSEARDWPAGTPRDMPFGALTTFFALAFVLGWGAGALMITGPSQAIFGPVSGTNPVFVLAVYSPAIAGIFLVWRHYGVRGLGRYFRRLALWRMPTVWWLFLLDGIPAVKYLGAAINGTSTAFPFSPWYGVLPALVAALLIGPVEELGWRGIALPLLQRRVAPLWASLILGAVWGVWHLPSFLLSGTPQSAWSFGPFAIGVLALSVIVTPLFNAARGSILVAMLFHFQMNGPAWPDAQPWENFLFALVAVAVVVLNRRTMLTRDAAVTEVLLPPEAGAPTETSVTGQGGT